MTQHSDVFLPYGRHAVLNEDISEVVAVLRGDFLTQGPTVDRLESVLAEQIGCRHVIAVNSGTAALHVAYAASGLGSGDTVIVPAITFAATANAALYCGASVYFCDVDPESGLMTAELVEKAIFDARAQGFKPRLIAPVHYAGLPVDMNEIVRVAKQNQLNVFEDACHALGGKYRMAGETKWRSVGNWQDESVVGASFSFHPVKHVATGEGGAIATNSDWVAKKSRMLRSHGITKNSQDFIDHEMAFDSTTQAPNPWYYEMQELGWNYRLSDINAALGVSQMQRLKERVVRRRDIAKWYDEYLPQNPALRKAASDREYSQHAYHLYPLQIDFEKFGTRRSQFMSQLREKNIGTQVHYIPVPGLPFYRKKGFQVPTGAQKFYDRQISLPMYPELDLKDVQRVVDAITQTLGCQK